MKINLGCGQYKLDGFVNIDSLPQYGDITADILDLPYENETVDEIYAGHVFEHVPWNLKFAALEEWKRVLKPGGRITLTVPDFFKSLELFNQGKISFDELNGIVYGNDDIDTIEGLHKIIVSDGILIQWLGMYFEDPMVWKDCPYIVADVSWQSVVTARKA